MMSARHSRGIRTIPDEPAARQLNLKPTDEASSRSWGGLSPAQPPPNPPPPHAAPRREGTPMNYVA
eukprot:CAMPEP_0195576452 /NCGR_PEP_ID=MMETSP0814-20130614/8947_1 /TAXON_ID=97485 /ORGANISM="Prymnesium parvum, Strain Texoma1" /LENGTH=65 /DNA_ID=CAMNT_0040712711 /DNA_START=383 /DNA_END=577 /DNA_ORIENTATION=+